MEEGGLYSEEVLSEAVLLAECDADHWLSLLVLEDISP